MKTGRRDSPARHVVFTMHSFAIGGVASLYATLARAAQRDGFRCTVLAADGPARESLDWGGAHLIPRDPGDPAAIGYAEELAGDASLTVTAVTPETTPLLPILTAAEHAVLVIHGSAHVMEEWLGAARLAVVGAVLRGRPAVGVMVPGLNSIDALHTLLDIPAGRFEWLPHATECPVDLRPPTGTPRATHVLCPTRLSVEKRFVIQAAADLAAAAGRRLLIVGSGPDVAWVERYLSDRGDVEGSVIQNPSLEPWLRNADVVVATGLVALEALARGCAVAVPSRDAPGVFADVVTPRTWNSLHAHNFLGLGTESMPVDEVWQALDALSPGDRHVLVDCVRRDASPDVAWRAVVAAGGAAQQNEGNPDEMLASMAATWLTAEKRLEDLVPWTGELTRARDYFRAQLEALEAKSLHEQEDAPDDSAITPTPSPGTSRTWARLRRLGGFGRRV